MNRSFALLCGLLLAFAAAVPARADLFISNNADGTVARYTDTGSFITLLSSSPANPGGIAFSGGNVLIADSSANNILSYNVTTGIAQGTLVSLLNSPLGVAVGPDGYLYVANGGNGSIQRFDASTGAFVSNFVAAGSGGLTEPAGVAWGSDGNLYVADLGSNAILQYSGTTGAFINTFIGSGLSRPVGIAFLSGNFYVADKDHNAVKIYDTSGDILDSLSASRPYGLTIGPDGKVYFSNSNTNLISVYDPVNGGSPSVFIGPDSNLTSVGFLAFSEVPEPAASTACVGLTAAAVALYRRRRF